MKMNNKEADIRIGDIEFWGEWEKNKGGMRIYWGGSIGFGHLDIFKDNNGNLLVETECLGKEFLRLILDSLYQKIKVIG
jgi:hypothetical protein